MPTGDYHDQGTTALTNAYVLFKFSTPAISYSIINDDAADNIEVSYDGVNQARSIAAGEAFNGSGSGNGSYIFGVYLKSTPAGASYRLETSQG